MSGVANKHLSGAWRTPLPARINSSQSQPDQQPPRHYNHPGPGYLANGAPGGPPQTAPAPGAVPLLPNQGRVIEAGAIRILCVADVRGKLHPPPPTPDSSGAI